MMPAWPAAPFVVVQSQFLFELLVVLLHSPAEFSQAHQAPQRDLLGQVREPILGGALPLATRSAARPVATRVGLEHDHEQAAPGRQQSGPAADLDCPASK